MQGFNETHLANLSLSSSVGVSTLGALNRWSSSQVSHLTFELN